MHLRPLLCRPAPDLNIKACLAFATTHAPLCKQMKVEKKTEHRLKLRKNWKLIKVEKRKTGNWWKLRKIGRTTYCCCSSFRETLQNKQLQETYFSLSCIFLVTHCLFWFNSLYNDNGQFIDNTPQPCFVLQLHLFRLQLSGPIWAELLKHLLTGKFFPSTRPTNFAAV